MKPLWEKSFKAWGDHPDLLEAHTQILRNVETNTPSCHHLTNPRREVSFLDSSVEVCVIATQSAMTLVESTLRSFLKLHVAHKGALPTPEEASYSLTHARKSLKPFARLSRNPLRTFDAIMCLDALPWVLEHKEGRPMLALDRKLKPFMISVS